MGFEKQWMRAMRRGDWEAAWRIGDRLLSTRGAGPFMDLPRHLRPVWDGSPLAGRRVLVRCHHGLGDTVQFVRDLPGEIPYLGRRDGTAKDRNRMARGSRPDQRS